MYIIVKDIEIQKRIECKKVDLIVLKAYVASVGNVVFKIYISKGRELKISDHPSARYAIRFDEVMRTRVKDGISTLYHDKQITFLGQVDNRDRIDVLYMWRQPIAKVDLNASAKEQKPVMEDKDPLPF
jgi:hypothetical protein